MLRYSLLLTLAFGIMSGCSQVKYTMADEMALQNRALQEQQAELTAANEALKSQVSAQNKQPAASTAPLESAAAAPAPAESTQRIMIYNAGVRLVVVDLTDARDAIGKIAGNLGGFLQSMNNSQVVIKVPAARLDEAMDAIAGLGEVTDRQIQGRDVTEEWHDLHIRLDNATRARQRLTELLAKAEKVEDMLKIENELTRLTETIEQIKGRLRWLKEAVAYSTITVHLNCPLPKSKLDIQVPFPWVQGLAGELIQGTRPANIDTHLFKRGISFELPESYVKYFEQAKITRALSADGVLLKVHSHANYQGGDLPFWTKLVRRTLLESRAITLDRSDQIALSNGSNAALFTGSRQIGGKMHGYLVAIHTTRGQVCVYEAWGPDKSFRADLDKIKASIKTLRD